MSLLQKVYITDAVRTPRGRGKVDGKLHAVPPYELVAQLARALQKRSGQDLSQVEDLILGIVTQTKDQGGCLAKTCAQMAGLSDDVPGSTVNRFCGSGLEAINIAFAKIASGQHALMMAGGVESMSRVPLGEDQAPWMSDREVMQKTHFVPQGISADLIASLESFSRQTVDQFAVDSQNKAQLAWLENRFRQSIIPIHDKSGNLLLDKDEHMRAGTNLDSLAKLKPAFLAMGSEGGFDRIALQRYPSIKEITHVHHAGNSSGIVDGAALVMLANEDACLRFKLKKRARIISSALACVDPTIMLTATVKASRQALKLAGLECEKIDCVEINEAFASVVLYFQKQMNIPWKKINPNGGAIAMGHPLGATGAMLVGTLVDELERTEGRFGLVTLCIGGGMGIASVIERV